MLIKRLLKDDKGAVLPLVALLLVVMLGFTAIVVDAGILYNNRRQMITAADAGALAGARELSDNDGKKTSDAIKIAEKVAVDNGADVGTVTAVVEERNGRQIIEVEVDTNSQLFFARLLGTDESKVDARSVATWGYLKSIGSGDILPLFLYDGYDASKIIALREIKSTSESNYGTLRLGHPEDKGGGADAVNQYLSRDKMYKKDKPLTTSTLLSGEAGAMANLDQGIRKRMEIANKITGTDELDILARKRIMTGLVAVINYDKLYAKAGGNLNGFLDEVIPIEYFVNFEIYDYVKVTGKVGNGIDIALYDNTNYLSDGISKNYGEDYDNGTILGKITGDPVYVVANVVSGDQTDPGSGGDASKYFKLIDADYIGD